MSEPATFDLACQRMVKDLQVRAEGGLLLVVTGAGVSVASGIPTFRGNDLEAVWKKSPQELGTRNFFERDPVESWRWFRWRFGVVQKAAPNPAHLALAALERWQADRGPFLLVTQNIDGLHRAAGSVRLVEVHGRADSVRCPEAGCVHAAPKGRLPRDLTAEAAFDADPSVDTLPRCPACKAILRQHVLWFDEVYREHDDYGLERVLKANDTAAVVWFLGTSMSVGITDTLLAGALRRRVPVAIFDPAPPGGLPLGVERFAVKAEELLPEVCRRLGAT